MRLSIIIVNDNANINGGAANVAISSAIGLAERGHDVALFSAVSPKQNYQKNLKVYCTYQHEILTDPNRIRAPFQGLWNFKSANEFNKILKKYDPNRTVIHFHSWTKALSSSVIKQAARSGFKTIFTFHDYFLACPNGGFFNFPENKICHLQPLSLSCVLKNCDVRRYSHKFWRVCRQVIQKHFVPFPVGFNKFIFVSRFSCDILEPFIPNSSNFYILDNPISCSKTDPVDVARNSTFIMVGRLSREKGPHLFARALRKIGAKGILVGDGPFRAEFQNEFPEIYVTGWLNRNDVFSFMRSARALVFPSLLYEAQPLIVQEAAALGVPSIVSDCSAAKELVIDQNTGMIFSSGNSLELSMIMKRLLDNPELVAKIGFNCYEKYWSNPPTLEKHLEKLENIYRQVLSPSKV